MTPQRRGGPRPRTPSRAAVRKQLLVFVEGACTEAGYVNELHRRHRERVIVTIDRFNGGPLQLVEHAVERRRVDKRDEKRGRGRAYDEIWCVFDVDEHPNLDQAIVMARDNEIRLAISNPCLELWFLLHFEDQAAWIHRHEAQRRASEFLKCGKTLTAEALDSLLERYEDARARALRLDEKHRADGSPERSNPSTNVWQIVESISRPG